MTGVFSYYCIWGTMVYRVSIIMYSRASCGNWLIRNYFTRILRRKLWDYVVENNGGIHYCDFHLTDQMQSFIAKQEVFVHKTPKRPPYFYLKPSKETLSETFYERWLKDENQPSRWKGFDTMLLTNPRLVTNPKWLSFDWDGRFKEPMKIIALPEFLCRYGFVSSFASQINRFRDHGEVKAPDEMLFQLIYIALLSSSQVLFYYVLDIFIQEKGMMLSKYYITKTLNNNDTDVTVFRRYQSVCKECEFPIMTGGPYNRFQPQPVKNNIFKCDVALRTNLKKIPQLIHNLERGKCLDTDGLLSKPTAKRLLVVGDVASLSFAPLVVFCGLATSVHSVNTAKQSPPNVDTPNSYYPKLVDFLVEHGYEEEEKTKPEKQSSLLRMFRSIAKSWGTVGGSIENGCCAAFRRSPKKDVFFANQDLYLLDDLCSHPKVKRYGSDVWEELTFD